MSFATLLAFTCCSTPDQQPTTFDSLEGAWFFADKQVTGEIWITELAGLEGIDQKGYFSFETFSFAVNGKSEIKYKASSVELIEYVYLLSANSFGTSELYLLEGKINESFTEITFQSFVLIRAQSVLDNFDRQIVMKRR